MKPQRINVDGVARLPAFSHAVIAGEHLHVSGMLGAKDGELSLVPGGVRAETTQTLRNIARILDACGGSFDDVVKVNVHLTDMSAFAEMNEAYLAFIGDDPPARITTGTTALALGAAVEMDCIGWRAGGWTA